MFLAAPEDIGSDLQSLVGNSHKLNMALRELLKYSLLRRNTTEHTIVVHRLVQAVLRGEMDEETRKQWAERAIKIVNRSFPAAKAVEEWPKCQQLLPHALACASFVEQWNLAFPEAAWLLNEAGVYLEGRAQYQEAEPLFQRALVISEEVSGPRHPNTANSLNNLGYIYRVQGKLAEAEPLFEQALTIRKEVLGERHPDTATSLNNLASLFHTQGKLEEAEPLYKQALDIFKQVLGPDHPNTRTVQDNYNDLLQQMKRDPQ
jgi:tetratricopeptide (TPR) repeat protein